MFFGPLFCGIMVGIILKNFELHHLITSTILMSFLSLMFIFLVYVFPQFLGIDIMPIFFSLEAPKLLALSSIFIFPLSIIGMIFGKALGDTLFLSEEEKIKQRQLRDDTRKWHEILTKKRKL